MNAKDVADVVGEVLQKGLLSGPGVAKDRCQPEVAQQVEGDFADGCHGRPFFLGVGAAERGADQILARLRRRASPHGSAALVDLE